MTTIMTKLIQNFSLLMLTTLLNVQPVLLAETLRFDGEIRERFEIWAGLNKKAYGDQSLDFKGKKTGNSNDALLLQRLILGLTYQSKRVTAKIHLYDASVWGWSLDQNHFIKNKGTDDEYVMNPYEEHWELFDGYLETRFNNQLSLKVGRQKIWYGDKRAFGPGSWGNSIGWLWDAARFSYKKKRHFFDIWYGQTKTKDPESFSLTSKHAYEGVGMYSRIQLPFGAIEPFLTWKKALFYNSGKQEESYFWGLRLFEPDFYDFNYDISGIKETGAFHQRTGPDLDIDAYAYVIKLGYTFKALPLQPKVVIGRVYASGDAEPDNDDITRFARPFGSTDGTHYGRLDAMFWGNMVDNQLNLSLKPHPKWDLKIAYHRFYLADKADQWTYYKYQVADNQYDHIGDEMDWVLKYQYSKSLQFQGIYAHLNAGRFITENEIAQNDASRFMLQVQYRFDYPVKMR
jgi:hypothetical protein